MTKKWAVCPTCRGNGTHVNPSIDAHGITGEEMAELGEDFREDYVSGVYDIPCNECGGMRVVPACSTDGCDNACLYVQRGYGDRRDSVSRDHYPTCWDHLSDEDRESEESMADMYATMAAERRMGA